jgi:hypothetical protein
MKLYALFAIGATLVSLCACSIDDWSLTVFPTSDTGATGPNEPFCTVAPPGAICEHEDPTFVAHCVDGECVPYECDYCPTPTCRDVFCHDGQCRQEYAETNTPCARRDADPYHLDLGVCSAGHCGGAIECSSTNPCPDIPCALVTCDDHLCHATFFPAGTTCTKPDGTAGLCSNHACVTPGGIQ